MIKFINIYEIVLLYMSQNQMEFNLHVFVQRHILDIDQFNVQLCKL